MGQVELRNADTSTNYNSVHATVDNIYILNANELIPMLNRLPQATAKSRN
ncbi:hypothetical protein [Nostoc sp.]